MKNNKRIFKRIAVIFLLFVVLSMWAAADAYAQNKIKYTYDSAGNRLSRQKEIVVQTRGALSDEEEPSVYEIVKRLLPKSLATQKITYQVLKEESIPLLQILLSQSVMR